MYNTVETESGLELLVEDVNSEALFSEALMGLSDVLSEASGGTPVTHEVRVRAPDLPGLLAGWVTELVVLAERDGFVPERVEKLRLEATSLSAVIAGERSIPQHLIRPAAYRDLDLERLDDGAWAARITLDA